MCKDLYETCLVQKENVRALEHTEISMMRWISGAKQLDKIPFTN